MLDWDMELLRDDPVTFHLYQLTRSRSVYVSGISDQKCTLGVNWEPHRKFSQLAGMMGSNVLTSKQSPLSKMEQASSFLAFWKHHTPFSKYFSWVEAQVLCQSINATLPSIHR